MSPIGKTALSSWAWGTDPCTRNWKGIKCKSVEGVRRVSQLQVSSVYIKTSIPSMFSLMFYLEVLDLDQCSLTGSLPKELSVLKNLQQLDVWKNDLTGKLSPQFSRWTQLQSIAINSNRISGTLPIEYSTWRNASELHFSFNAFSGQVPQEYSKLLPLSYFYVEPQEGNGLCISQEFRDEVLDRTSRTNALSISLCP
eukprot:TRINITY_DN3645_c0_g1_i7.p3 TRINITY_DN3645_c0_g1~~TRINITY_DN3645_c0_g1_i7.p3  ORF type:complete len:231 (-),score=17.29 TRINITY_DN3645_c0_g1_i7:740-1330(-)